MGWDYTGTILRWVDGDTVIMRVEKVQDFGFRIIDRKEYTGRFRLAMVDTPERGEPGYEDATRAANRWAPVGESFPVTTYSEDSFGRWICDIMVEDSTTISELLLVSGNAEVWT
jgi:endonuclease YncB( thermonuclease family)